MSSLSFRQISRQRLHVHLLNLPKLHPRQALWQIDRLVCVFSRLLKLEMLALSHPHTTNLWALSHTTIKNAVPLLSQHSRYPQTGNIQWQLNHLGNSHPIKLHPECSTWPYPIIYQKNSRRIHYNCEYPTKPTGCFWVNIKDQTSTPCLICNLTQGYKIKVTPTLSSVCTTPAISTITAVVPNLSDLYATWSPCSN
jgi:hypothetical protein